MRMRERKRDLLSSFADTATSGHSTLSHTMDSLSNTQVGKRCPLQQSTGRSPALLNAMATRLSVTYVEAADGQEDADRHADREREDVECGPGFDFACFVLEQPTKAATRARSRVGDSVTAEVLVHHEESR